jgi:DNA topoisomerase-1
VKPGACAKCGSALIERKGKKKGAKPFFGCVRYGAAERPCDYVEWAAGGREGGRAGASLPASEGLPASAPSPSVPPSRPPAYRREATEKTCPKCGTSPLALLHPAEGVEGAAFYACEDRACKFTLPLGARRRREPCPKCGGLVLERRRKDGGAFWACAKYPECRYAADMTMPVRP